MIAISPSSLASDDRFTRQLEAAETAKAEAHEAYLRVSGNIAQTLSNQLAFQMALIEVLIADPASASRSRSGELEAGAMRRPPTPTLPNEGGAEPSGERRGAPATPALDRAQCLEFAVGSIGGGARPRVRGDRRPSDAGPAAGRAADAGGPDRGDRGRAAVAHERDEWSPSTTCSTVAGISTAGGFPTCIAVEAGQADLFLSGYLGIDFVTKGLAVYRLLDAVVTFHRSLPGPGAVIVYDIKILEFFRQGDTHLFRFQFEATVDGAPLMSMRDGCAGFFTAEELAAGKGIVPTPLDLAPRAGRPARRLGRAGAAGGRVVRRRRRSTPCGGATWPPRSGRRSRGSTSTTRSACPAGG